MFALFVFFLVFLHLLKFQGLVFEALEILVFGLFFPEVLNKYVSITENTVACRVVSTGKFGHHTLDSRLLDTQILVTSLG